MITFLLTMNCNLTNIHLSNLKSSDDNKLFAALDYFNELMDRHYLPDIIEVYFMTTDVNIKIEAFKVIMQVGARKNVTSNELYIESVIDTNVDTTIYKILSDAIHSPSQPLNILALLEIKFLKLKQFRIEVLKMLTHRDNVVRSAAISTYKKIGTKNDLILLYEVIRSDSIHHVINNALETIEYLGDSKTAVYLEINIKTFPDDYQKSINEVIKKLSEK